MSPRTRPAPRRCELCRVPLEATALCSACRERLARPLLALSEADAPPTARPGSLPQPAQPAPAPAPGRGMHRKPYGR